MQMHLFAFENQQKIYPTLSLHLSSTISFCLIVHLSLTPLHLWFLSVLYKSPKSYSVLVNVLWPMMIFSILCQHQPLPNKMLLFSNHRSVYVQSNPLYSHYYYYYQHQLPDYHNRTMFWELHLQSNPVVYYQQNSFF